MDNSLVTRKKATVATDGQMVVSMKAGGTKASNTALESTIVTKPVKVQSTAFGRMASASNGSAMTTSTRSRGAWILPN